MTAMRNTSDERDTQNQNGHGNAQTATQPVVVPTRSPGKPVPAPGRKMSFQEAVETSVEENKELLQRLA